MRLHSPRFERRLKRLTLRTVRRSPALRREFRRSKRHRRNVAGVGGLFRIGITALLCCAAWSLNADTGHMATALAAFSIYLLAVACLRMRGLWQRLNLSPELGALSACPLSDAEVFDWLWRKHLRESLFLALDIAAVLATLAWLNGFASWQWMLLPVFVAVGWLYLLGLSLMGFLKLPRRLFQLVTALAAAGLPASALVLFIGWKAMGPQLVALLDRVAGPLGWVLPTAWALNPFAGLQQSHNWWMLISWLPVVFVLGRLQPMVAELRAGFGLREGVMPAMPDLVPGEDSGPLIAAGPDGASRQMAASGIERLLMEGAYLRQPWHPVRGYFDSRLWAWLSPRERAIAELVHPGGFSLDAFWRRSFYVLGGTMVSAAAAGTSGPTLKLVCLGVGAFILLCMTLAVLSSHGRAFQAFWTSGVTTPVYASYGIGYRELSGFLLKQAVVQLPYLFMAWVAMGGFSAWCLELPVAQGLVFGFKLAGLLFAGRFVMMVFGFSSGTNDTDRLRFSSMLLLAAMAVLGLGFAAAGGAGLFVPDWRAATGLWAGALVDAWLLARVYGFFYRHSRFDLMKIPRQ